jgi:hypothetical protein
VAERKAYSISDEERQRRSERLAAQNRKRAEERRQALERGELPAKRKPEQPIDDDPVDIDLELRKVIRNPKATPQAKKDALRILHEREREERERARAERDSDALLARVQVDLRARVPPVTFEDQLERWREIALDHGFELKAVPIEEDIALEADELEAEPDIEPEPAPIGAEAPEVEEEPPATPEPAPRGNVVRWPVGPNEDPYAGLGPVGTGTPKGTAASGGYDHGVDPTLGSRPY